MGYDYEDLKLLQLHQSADEKAIERNYELLLKRYMNTVKDGTATEEDKETMERITLAYERLTGKPHVDKKSRDRGQWFTGFNKESYFNFIFHYKYQLIGGLFGLFAVIFLIVSMLTKPQVICRFGVIGDYNQADHPISVGYNPVEITRAFDPNMNGIVDFKSANQLGSGAVVAAYISGKLDFFLVNENMFSEVANEGYFISLDELAKESKLDIKKQQNYIMKSKIDDGEHLYGVKVTNEPALSKMFPSSKGGEVVLAIARNTKKKELTEAFMKRIMVDISR